MRPALFLFLAAWVPAAALAGEVTIRLSDWAGLDELALTQQALREFQALHPDIRVLYEPNPGRQYEEKLLTALAAGSP